MVSTSSYKETVDTAVVFHPAVRQAPPCDRGVFMGPLLGDPIAHHFDPHDYMEEGVAGSTVTVMAGAKNGGKSAHAKSTSRRLRLRRADEYGRVPRISAFDLKPEEQDERDETGTIIIDQATMQKKRRRVGEWRPLAEANGCTPIEVAKSRMNFMHPDLNLTFSQNFSQASLLAEDTSGHDLDYYHRTALQTGIWLMREHQHGLQERFDHLYVALRRWEEADTLNYMRSIDDKLVAAQSADPGAMDVLEDFKRVLAQPINLDVSRMRRAASEMAMTFKTVLDNFGDMFTGDVSPYKMLSQEVVVHDCNNMSDEEIALYQAQHRIIRASAAIRGDDNLKVDIENHEENYASWQQRTYARDMFPYIKTVRAHGTYIVLIVQFPRDYLTVGSDGSEEQRKAIGMLSNVDHFFFTGMPATEIQWMSDNIFEMNETERALAAHLKVGQFGHKVMPNHDITWYQHLLMASDYPIIESNSSLKRRQAQPTR